MASLIENNVVYKRQRNAQGRGYWLPVHEMLPKGEIFPQRNLYQIHEAPEPPEGPDEMQDQMQDTTLRPPAGRLRKLWRWIGRLLRR
jgi:hypothetical protein